MGEHVRALPGTATAESVADALGEAGAVIVEDFLEQDLLRRLRAEAESQLAATAPGSRSADAGWQRFHGRRTKRFASLAARCPSYWEVLRQPVLRGVADTVLLPHCGCYWLNTAQMMAIGPGEGAQLLHRDEDNWPLFSTMFGPGGPDLTLSAMIALSNFTERNGATRLIPGSHRWADFGRPGSPDETVEAVMPAGSALLYSGKVVHGGGANSTGDELRLGLHVSFVLGWLTPEEANPLAASWEHVQALPEDVQRLLGWGSYDPAPHRGGRLWMVDFEELRLTLLPRLSGAVPASAGPDRG